MRLSKLSLLAGAALVACAAPDLTPQVRAVEEQFVQDRLGVWTTAMNNKELDALLALYHDDPALTVVWPDGIRANGLEEQEQAVRNFYNMASYMNFVAQSPTIEVLSAEIALVKFRHSTDIRYVDTRRELSAGHALLVWVKDPVDDLWKIHSQLISQNPQ